MSSTVVDAEGWKPSGVRGHVDTELRKVTDGCSHGSMSGRADWDTASLVASKVVKVTMNLARSGVRGGEK
jgi:hypothetical protein